MTREAERRIVIFFRKDGWYPLELPVTDDLAKHAECNPGTLRIEDHKGNVLWRPQ
jgi:hypothetical protein